LCLLLLLLLLLLFTVHVLYVTEQLSFALYSFKDLRHLFCFLGLFIYLFAVLQKSRPTVEEPTFERAVYFKGHGNNTLKLCTDLKK